MRLTATEKVAYIYELIIGVVIALCAVAGIIFDVFNIINLVRRTTEEGTVPVMSLVAFLLYELSNLLVDVPDAIGETRLFREILKRLLRMAIIIFVGVIVGLLVPGKYTWIIEIPSVIGFLLVLSFGITEIKLSVSRLRG